jgi:hypothetical protein
VFQTVDGVEAARFGVADAGVVDDGIVDDGVEGVAVVGAAGDRFDARDAGQVASSSRQPMTNRSSSPVTHSEPFRQDHGRDRLVAGEQAAGQARDGPHAASVIYRVLAVPGGGDHAPVILVGHNVVVDSSAHGKPHFRR